jgi:hypothetical protein
MPKYAKMNNERSEAIELIKLMDSIVKRNTWLIKTVGGESTLNTGEQRMFPDVFLYGDTARTLILHGWEVKMPDVPITDSGFIHDAWRKANVLGVNSCVIWNFTYGVLYIKNAGGWTILREWNRTSHIRTRADVATYKADWESLVADMLSELNGFFQSGELRPAKIGDVVSDTVFAELVRRNKNITADHIRAAGVKDTIITAHISAWWRSVEKEYKFDEVDKFSAYAKYILLNWINKFTFANMIKRNHNPAAIVEMIDANMSAANALKVFDKITSECDFFNIFEPMQYGDVIPELTWIDLTDYNAFLAENGLTQISQTALQSVLEKSVNQFKRSVAGVFTTPQRLAEILVRAGITDLTAPAVDPCCGTGTIAKEILTEKGAAIGVERAFATTYASDKSSFALQISNIAMTRADAINLPSLLFRSNAFDLREGKEVDITDPQSGALRKHRLPKWGSVISNLPFVSFDQEGREESVNIATVIERVRSESGIALSGRADLYQALLLNFFELLTDNASIAVITSNSWLGTIAGQEFFKVLNYYYTVESIVASGNGKWFDNADVITLMLFLKNKPTPTAPNANHAVNFGLIHKPLANLTADDTAQIADSIKLKCALSPELLSFKPYSIGQIGTLLGMNIALNSFFYDVDWLSSIEGILCPVSDLFSVFRGIKTGQDEIYYLRNRDEVDPEYIGRVFKSAKSAEYLTAWPDTDSFVCGKSLAELVALGHKKTLAWIDRYKGHINQSVPHKDTFWMNLADGTFSGSDKIRLFTGMNPERRFFYGLLAEPAQINQRAIGFKPLSDSVNIELCHALLNSVIGVFYLEASGFPKGLGALDINSENISKTKMLDPRRLSASQAKKILAAFKPLLARNILATEQEYRQFDRLTFERIVADCCGYTVLFERIRNCVLEMQTVRLSVSRKIGSQ